MHVIRLQHDFVQAVRDHQREEDGHGSDDEVWTLAIFYISCLTVKQNDDVIAPLRHANSKGEVMNILGPEFHWRSRPAMETERLFNQLYRRHEVICAQRDYDHLPDLDEEARPFTTFDTTVRDSSRAMKMVDALVEALQASQKVTLAPIPPPLISNSEAIGLQALANASAASAATDAAMRDAEERAKAREESILQAKKEEELSRPSPLSVPKPSLSRTPDEPQPNIPISAPPTNVPTPVQTPRSEHVWPVEPRQERQETQQQQQQTAPLPPQHPQMQALAPPALLSPQQYTKRSLPQPQVKSAPRPATSFSQVALGPSLTETAPPVPAQISTTQFPPHPIIPGLMLYPSNVQIPGLSSQSLPGLNLHKPPTPTSIIRDPPATQRAPMNMSLVDQVTPAHATANDTGRGQEERDVENHNRSRPQDPSATHSRTPSVPDAPAKSTGKDFWSSLARGATENGINRVKSASKGSLQEMANESLTGQPPTPHFKSEDLSSSSRPSDILHVDTHPLGPREINHPLGQVVDRFQGPKLERLHEHYQDQAQEYPRDRHGDRTSERPSESSTAQDYRASSRLPSIASATGSDVHPQRQRSSTDAFGPLLERLSASEAFTQPKKKPKAPKTSLYGGWPRSRNYDPFKNEQNRRASGSSMGGDDGPHSMQPRQASGYSTPGPEHRHPLPPYHTPQHSQPPPPFPVSAPPQGPYHPPPPQYASVPSPYGYDQRAAPYQQSPYGPPTGFSSLPGPPPLSQPPPQSPYYQGPQPPYPPPPVQYAPHPPPLAARPPVTQIPYGPQYGGQPILPANPGPAGYGQTGAAHGAPGPGHAGPAFAQYHREDYRGSGYGRGRGRHGSGGQEWKHYQGPHR